MTEIQTLWVGRAAHPNNVTGEHIFIEWKAERVPLRECEGGGWYSLSSTKTMWAFSYKAAHKSSWSIPNTRDEPLDVLLKRAVLNIYTRHCKTTNVCACKQGYVSQYDHKCGHCRTPKEQKLHQYKLLKGLYKNPEK